VTTETKRRTILMTKIQKHKTIRPPPEEDSDHDDEVDHEEVVDDDDDDDGDDDDDDESSQDGDFIDKDDNVHEGGDVDGAVDDKDNDEGEDGRKAATKKKKVYKLSLTETENFNEKLKKRGVLYIARIPPRMTPTKIKALLSDFGEVTRVYLVEEDATVRKRRKKEHGGSGGKRYIEGWVEFANKGTAKHVARSLNNTQISNQKRNPHYGGYCLQEQFGLVVLHGILHMVGTNQRTLLN
jgi:hypothetical protein